MYRIIGINSLGQMKIIKKEALNNTLLWGENGRDRKWPDSDLYKGLNGSVFLDNTTYVPSGWSNKIATTTWKYGDNMTNNTTAENLYSIENGWSDTTSAKIGLMYAHDYYYAYQSGGLNCSFEGGISSICKNSWIYLWNSGNDSGVSNIDYEWTMSRAGYFYDGNYYAWTIHLDGYYGGNYLGTSNAVRPVFFLTSDIEYVSGTGTLSDPIIIQ